MKKIINILILIFVCISCIFFLKDTKRLEDLEIQTKSHMNKLKKQFKRKYIIIKGVNE